MEWSDFCQCVPAIECLASYLTVGEWSRLRVASIEFARMSKTLDTVVSNRQRDLGFWFMDVLLLKSKFDVVRRGDNARVLAEYPSSFGSF